MSRMSYYSLAQGRRQGCHTIVWHKVDVCQGCHTIVWHKVDVRQGCHTIVWHKVDVRDVILYCFVYYCMPSKVRASFSECIKVSLSFSLWIRPTCFCVLV